MTGCLIGCPALSLSQLIEQFSLVLRDLIVRVDLVILRQTKQTVRLENPVSENVIYEENIFKFRSSTYSTLLYLKTA